jgi:NTP pyrophosphatase (non-canonical NTP hydrolase)
MKSDIEQITDEIKIFRDERDWGKYHDAKNLAICLNIESSELLEIFLWKEANDVDPNKVKKELADVFYSAFLLADNYQFNVLELIREKLQENMEKYPVDKFKGSNRKYNEL